MSAVVATDMLAVTDVVRTFGSGRTATRALRGVSFGVGAGQLVALRGRSGSGKTTLLNIVGGLDLPDSGQVRVDGRDVTAMSEHERMELRRSSVAFIFQSFGLIPILSAAENVGVPLRIAGMAPKDREERVRLMLDIVGLGEHAKQRPGELSSGQQQRVAGRDRPGAGRQPAGAAGRRAHRPARLGDGEADHAAAAHRGAIRGSDRPGRHPRPQPHRHRRLRPRSRGRHDQGRLIPNGHG
jgi:predicted ABC-type transport system involved in lysophospholipase L1 biosynthesis ATPase subunit